MTESRGPLQYAEHVQLYARKGFWCVPLWHSTPDGCGCGDPVCEYPGAHPIRSTIADGSCKEEELLPLFRGYPAPNVGIITGSPSGIIAVSVDIRIDGSMDSWHRLTDELGLETATDTVSGSYSQTAIYRLPEDFPVLPEKLIREDFPGITLLAEGSYVVAPPSIDPYTDTPYQWKGMDKLATIKREILDLFLEPMQHLTTLPIPKTKLSYRDSLIYLKGFYQHLRGVGRSVSEARDMTFGKRISLTSPPTPAEITSMIEEIEEPSIKEDKHEFPIL